MTNPTATFSRPDAEVERPDLSDLLGMVAKLHAAAPGSHEFDQIALALSTADVEAMDGLVINGLAYNVTWRQMWGACRCDDGKCDRNPLDDDADFWRPTKRDAEDRVARMVERRGRWEKDGPVPHLASQLVARTSVERVR